MKPPTIALCTRRLLPIFCLSASFGLLGAPAVWGGDALFHQGGVGFDVDYDDERVLILTAGPQDPVDLAILLTRASLTTSLSPVGNSEQLFEVGVGQVTGELLAAMEEIPEVLYAGRVVRFREDGLPFGIIRRVNVKFGTVLSPSEISAFEDAYDLQYLSEDTELMGLDGIYIFEVLGGAVLDRVTAMHSDPRLVDWKASPDHISVVDIHQTGAVIDDALFDQQWHLENTGQSGGLEDADIDALLGWEAGSGDGLGGGIVMGMHDSGCEVNHPDLLGNFTGNSLNVINNGEIPVDLHGTAVMGLMAAADNTIGVRGVAPGTRFSPSGPLVGVPSFEARAFQFAIDAGVSVHNNSWGYALGNLPDILREAVVKAANEGRNGRGIVITWAAGNGNRQGIGIGLQPGQDFATLPEVIQVGATGQNDTIATYSNYGVTQDVMGPSLGDDGVGVVTTDLTGSSGFNDGSSSADIQGQPDYTRQMSGTSASAPIVAGVAALVLATNEELNRVQVREILTHTADQVAPLDAQYEQTTGFSLRYGFGRVNAAAAVEAAQDSSSSFNRTWPGVPIIQNARVVEDPLIEADVSLFLEWEPVGMPPDEDDEPIEETDESGILIAYLPSPDSGETIRWRPTDGVTYTPGELDVPDDGARPDPGNPDMVIIYSDAAQNEEGPLRQVSGLGLEGDDEEEQLFAVYAFNEDALYSFGVVFDQDGNIQSPVDQPGGGETPLPPDTGPPSIPELPSEPPGLNDPPSVSATASVKLGVAPLPIQFHGSAVTPNELVDRGWSFGDGASSDEASVMHTYAQPGIFNAVYFAEDVNGDISTKMLPIQVVDEDDPSGPGDPPVSASVSIEVVTPGTPQAPNALVRFKANTTGIGTSAGSTVTYDWNFGDGETGQAQSTENIYALPGLYVVQVDVTETRAGGQVVSVSASDVIEIGGSSGSSGPSTPPSGQPINQGAGGDSCGMVGFGMIAFVFFGLLGMKRRRWA